MVGLNVYKVKDKETYNQLNSLLVGWCFFRYENGEYFIKVPLNNTIKNLIEMGSITESNQTKTEV
jgi:hypothetical protein